MSYWSMPHKIQVLILMLARLTDSLAAHSIHSYMFFQVRHFDPDAPAALIATRCGLLVGAKTGAHVCTGLFWGRLADRILKSRKVVLVSGLLASSAATVGYGFSTTFLQAISWQMLDGALNATVAMIRCMTAELQTEEKYRVRAFALLPLFANVGSVLGPLIGGFLSSTDSKHSAVRGYPYALPNICVAAIEALVAMGAIICLPDTFWQEQTRRIGPSLSSRRADSGEPIIRSSEDGTDETTALLQRAPIVGDLPGAQDHRGRLDSCSIIEIWTPNVLKTMFAQFIIAGHLGTFATLWAMLLSLPAASSSAQRSFFQFSGGIGLPPQVVGIAMSIFGFTGIILQVLVYPSLQEKWGTVRVWKAALYLFPVVYFSAPFCARIPLLKGSLEQTKSGVYPIVKWSALLSVLLLFAAGRTGVVPATSLLINDCTPHPGIRGTIHTTGVVCSNLSKSVFPPMALAVMGYGIQNGVIGLGFWFVTILAILSIIASVQVRQSNHVA